jgi:large subunit ribosomal protein L29
MKIDKVRQMDKAELSAGESQAREQMFRLRLQMKMGQSEGIKKYRTLKKDRARMLTVERERALAAETPARKEAK